MIFAQVQWRWILGITVVVISLTSLTLFVGLAIYATIRATFDEIPSRDEMDQLSELVGGYIGPLLLLGLTFIGAVWLTQSIAIRPRLHGWLVGLSIGLSSILLEVLFSPSLKWNELVTTLLVPLVGWLGGYRSEILLKKRTALYHTSQAIKGADRVEIIQAIGEHLADSATALILLVSMDGKITSTWEASTKIPLPSRLTPFQNITEPATVLRGNQMPWQFTGIRSILLLPISAMDEVLLIGSRRRNGFSRTDIQNYLTIIEQVTLSLENLRLIEQARRIGMTQERDRLAAEIHDGLTQGFISIVTRLELAEAKLESYPSELQADLQELLNQARQTARDNLSIARQMTWALRPDLQGGLPLVEALSKLTQTWAQANNIPVMFKASGETRRLHPDVETVLLRAAREALNNIQKHAQADQVTATLTYLDTLVALDVADNGQGFDPQVKQPTKQDGGFGLKSLQVQADRLGGELSIESAPGSGCIIALSIPDNRGENL